MLIHSWNVNGIRAVLRRGDLQSYLGKYAPDIVGLQEIKALPEQIEFDDPNYPHRIWHSAKRKGYSGTAILSKVKPNQVHLGMGVERHDQEGRITAAEFDNLYVVSVYVPNSKQDLSRLADRQDWDKCFLAFLKDLEKHKPVAVGGDYNVAHHEIDLARPKENVGEHGFTDEERAGFQAIIDAGFIDTWRSLNPGKRDCYTWWKQIANARARNVGWRIDYWLISKALQPRLKNADILADVMGSDHCPVAVELQ